MNIIYQNIAEEAIKKVVLIPGTNNAILHFESTDDGVSKKDLINLASKGLVLVQVSGVNYEVLSFSESTNYATVTVAMITSGSVTPANFYSAGYVAG